MSLNHTGKSVKNWRGFASYVRGKQEQLLIQLDAFTSSVLVTGCQRSGGTMLARMISDSEGMTKYSWSNDEELDAALILSGSVPHHPVGRYCFQTTYLNERYPEYFEHPNHYIIWSLRNPHSVVFSMLYNWKRFALNELFLHCGYEHMNYRDRVQFQRFGLFGVSPLLRAVYAYVGKTSQLFKLEQNYAADRLTILDYDVLVRDKGRLLPRLYERIQLSYKPGYGAPISNRSLGKKSRLKTNEVQLIDDLCMPIYNDALALVNLQ